MVQMCSPVAGAVAEPEQLTQTIPVRDDVDGVHVEPGRADVKRAQQRLMRAAQTHSAAVLVFNGRLKLLCQRKPPRAQGSVFFRALRVIKREVSLVGLGGTYTCDAPGAMMRGFPLVEGVL